MNLFVANLDYKLTEEELLEIFSEIGAVTSAKIITDRETGRSRGFGFVEMADDTLGQAAIEELDGAVVNERELSVSEAKPRERRERTY
ncbi:MAG: RNA-binding protein [Cyclobacteriaceae bacterium]|nr:RNA-binding protein [Cyclobacteriaceae bacterium]MCH8517058.1 RNA-binding protein [Cyclobacteriaceae bacterium]